MENQSKLKAWVLVGRTVNLGRFNSVKLEVASEFLVDEETTHEHMIALLNEKIAKAVRSMGLVERYD